MALVVGQPNDLRLICLFAANAPFGVNARIYIVDSILYLLHLCAPHQDIVETIQVLRVEKTNF